MFGPAHKILILIAYEQKPPLIAHAVVSCGARGLNFGLSLHLHLYFGYTSRVCCCDDSGDFAHFLFNHVLTLYEG